jgi:tetraacyldisaccharide 4'-kinase
MRLPELLYYAGYSVHKRYGTKNRKRLPCKVLSIGNITLGGTGKTPAAIALAMEAKTRGFRPCILTRGYKGKVKGPCFVSNGSGSLMDSIQAGDEAVLMAEKLKDVPIVKGSDRYEAGMFAIGILGTRNQEPGTDFLFILDDGFQHWGLFRDKDILLIDGTNPFGNRRLLPLGYLREPLKAIGRADIIVITNALELTYAGEGKRTQSLQIEALIKELKKYNAAAPIFFSEHRPVKFKALDGKLFSLDWARDKSLYGFCGLGNPLSFRHTLLSTGTDLKGFKTFRDHYTFSVNDMRAIARDAEKSGAGWIVTTEKDIMRLGGFDLPDNLVSLVIEFQVGEKFYDEVFRF